MGKILEEKIIKYLNRLGELIGTKSIPSKLLGIDRISIEIDEINIVELMGIHCGNKIYFSPSDGSFSTFAMLGLREYKTDKYENIFKNIIENDISLFLNEDIKIFGGISFSADGEKENIWKEFPVARFILPKFEIIKKNNKYYFAYNFYFNNNLIMNYEDDKSELIAKFNWNLKKDNNSVKIYKHCFYPNFKEWSENINKAKILFIKEEYIKIALARKTTFNSKDKIYSLIIFDELINNSINSYNFYFNFNDSIFLGNSPEKLFKIENNNISSDSLAGTRKRGFSKIKDVLLENELLNSSKDIDEFNIVKEDIVSVLGDFCINNINYSETKVKKYKNVQHLFSEIKGELKEHYSVFNIIERLHPTPAVGTMPKYNNDSIIAYIEGFDRGWYAGPIGYFSKNKSDFSVGIRSCLINGNKIDLFTGAGITKDSEANSEWEEINNKMSDYLDIINYDIN